MSPRRMLLIGLPVFLVVLALPAYGDLSIVAELDSNYTNGPDTLLVEPTDTVLVRIWITGQDSLILFGITLGDTTGALSWVEEEPADIYLTPPSWFKGPPVERDGWLLIQSMTFGTSQAIGIPCEVARLKFVVAAGDSCGTLRGDLEQTVSAWLNADTETGLFSHFEGPTICVTEVQGGGESSGGEGEGGIAGGEDQSGPGDRGDEPDPAPTSFTRTFEVPDENYLFIHGHRIRGLVECTWTKGEPLYMNGYQIVPPPNPAILPLSEERLQQMHGQTPLVVELVNQGMTWREASLEWSNRITQAEKGLRQAYFDEWKRKSSRESAREAAEQTFYAVAADLADPAIPMTWEDRGVLTIHWEGYAYPARLDEIRMQNEAPREINIFPTYGTALKITTEIRDVLRSRGRSIILIPSGGGLTSISTSDSEPRPSSGFHEALQQIQNSTPQSIESGHLKRSAVREILDQGGLNQ